MCRDGNGQVLTTGTNPNGNCGAGTNGIPGVDSTAKQGSCGVAAATEVAFYTIKVKQVTTYTYPGGVVQAGSGISNVVTLTEAQWPQDYCIDFEITFPDAVNQNVHGNGGVIAFLGTYGESGLQIEVTHTSKLFRAASGNNHFGLMARDRSSNSAPMFGTNAFAALGSRHRGRFCYLASPINEPSWEIDGQKGTAQYLNLAVGATPAEFPTDRSKKLNLFAGDGTTKMGGAATLHSFKIDKIESCSMEAADYDFYKLA